VTFSSFDIRAGPCRLAIKKKMHRIRASRHAAEGLA
jgi:hypothetical protein